MMTREDAIKWIADIFEEPAERMTPDTPRSEITAWDSLGVLTLMARFDEDLSILLSEAELQEFHRIGDVLEAMKRHGKLN
jgi:acyl carrier protein